MLYVTARAGGFRGRRDASADSVMVTREPDYALFSPASASADRCSLASDALDNDCLVSEISLHLAGHGDARESWSGPALKLKQSRSNAWKQRLREEGDTKLRHVDDVIQSLDPARNFYSLALRECRERRFGSEALPEKLEGRRPSLDLDNSVPLLPIS
ncbi:hypothetical protein Nepgr_018508 [Nepenthes gracilis]|uniref:Uncharacterized protein n=1 Tax=Nepenthes gracilis TaxID=150966 RepID=A0AAD3SU54_NEPGR|nr:hypothetical protein Nepgr_018508 [Nepenthes gracilis]